MIEIPWLVSNQETVNHMLVYVLLASSVYVAMRAGLFSVAGVGFWAIGGYLTAVLTLDSVPPVIAVLGSVVLAVLVGYLLAKLVTRLRHLSLAMVTIAFVLLMQATALSWESVTGGALGLFGIPLVVGPGTLFLIVLPVVLLVALFERGRAGRALEALRLDEQMAQSVGIEVNRQRVIAFTLSAALGGLGGSLNVLQLGIITSEQAGFGLVVDALTMVVIGGTAAWYGPVIGAAVVVWLPEMLRFSGEWRTVVQGAIVVVLVVYAPGGAVGLVRATKRLFSARLAIRVGRAEGTRV